MTDWYRFKSEVGTIQISRNLDFELGNGLGAR
jgi:hypothetical protein